MSILNFPHLLSFKVRELVYGLRWEIVRDTPSDSLKMCWIVSDDIPSVHIPEGYELTNAPLKHAPDGWISLLRKAGVNATTETWNHEYGGRDAVGVLLMYHNLRLVGTAGLRTLATNSPDYGAINWVVVDPSNRGIGLGTILTVSVMALARTLEMKALFLRTDDFRLPAIKTYFRLGFRPCLTSWDKSHAWRWKKIMRMTKLHGAYCRNQSHAVLFPAE